jgi:hypothetical protein
LFYDLHEEFDMKRLDFGYVVGVGVSYLLSTHWKLSFEVSGHLGVVHLSGTAKEDESFERGEMDSTFRNQSFNFLFGCSYTLYKK